MKEFLSKKEKVLEKQLKILKKKENKLLIKKKENVLDNKISQYKNKLEKKIPSKLKDTLEVAFEKGFNIVLKNGLTIIEKSFNKEKINKEFNIDDFAINEITSKKNIKKIDKRTAKKVFFNQSIGMIEGGVLGILGIGLPDIPIFIGVMLKTIYEIAMGYGFSYANEDEKIYILKIICSTMSTGEEKKYYIKEIDFIADQIDNKIQLKYDLDILIKETSNKMATLMLTNKFIQGLPVVGVLGGFTNYKIIKDISKIAKIKYKKRYLKTLK